MSSFETFRLTVTFIDRTAIYQFVTCVKISPCIPQNLDLAAGKIERFSHDDLQFVQKVLISAANGVLFDSLDLCSKLT